MKPLLSILIPTVYGRESELNKLLDRIKLCNSLVPHDTDIQVIVERDNKEMSIGEKRELLYRRASGLFSWQIDDDDSISEDALAEIFKAIEQEPDCITFEESVTIDGKYSRSNFSLKYKEWKGDGNTLLEDGFQYQRSPFYKCVIKTEIARNVPFPKIRYNEDEQWSILLMPYISSEVHIDKQLYIYSYESTPFNERYGIL
jgi:hypothetical protein